MATLGTFILEASTSVRLDGAAGEVGTDFDWEENFGGSDGSRFRVDGAWRFADRHKVRGMWFNYSRERSAVFDREVDWGDVTFPVNATVEGLYEFDIYELAYEYAFLRRENLEVSGSFGLHLAQFKLEMSAEVETAAGLGHRGDRRRRKARRPAARDRWPRHLAHRRRLLARRDGPVLRAGV